MDGFVYLPVDKLNFEDLFDWSIPVQRCKTNKLLLSPSKSPRKNGIVIPKKESHECASMTICNEKEIALFRYEQRVFAVDEKCPHAGGPLHLGEIEDIGSDTLCVRCPWHSWKIELHTGQVMFPKGHSLQNTTVYPVKVTDQGRLYIGFSGIDEKYFQIESIDF